MKFFKSALVVLLAALFILAGNTGAEALEHLDEMDVRAARRASATWSSSLFEDPSTYKWQPETLMYQDITTEHEVWKISNTAGLTNYYHIFSLVCADTRCLL